MSSERDNNTYTLNTHIGNLAHKILAVSRHTPAHSLPCIMPSYCLLTSKRLAGRRTIEEKRNARVDGEPGQVAALASYLLMGNREPVSLEDFCSGGTGGAGSLVCRLRPLGAQVAPPGGRASR